MSTTQPRHFVAVPPNWSEMTEDQRLAWAAEFLVILGEREPPLVAETPEN